SAIVQQPERADLWDKFQDILTDIENEQRLDDAERFYYENREEMDKGTKVLWENRFSYFDLMVKKADVGSRAFASEYLNLPSDEESSIFKKNTSSITNEETSLPTDRTTYRLSTTYMAFGILLWVKAAVPITTPLLL